MTEFLFVLAIVGAILLVPRVQRWRRARAAGWRLKGWRHVGGDYELQFHNGIVVRDMKLYPSGESLVDSGWFDRCLNLQQQLDWGQHKELKLQTAEEQQP